MANDYTTDQLVSDVTLLGHIPLGNSTFSPSDIITLANLELQTPILAQILDTRGGYYITYADYPIVSTGLYSIPSDAVGGTLENVELYLNPSIIPVNLIQESEQYSTISPTATSYGYFMKGNYVQILPVPNVGVARLWYAKRPGQLVPTNQCGKILLVSTDITGLYSIFTLSSIPTTMTVGTVVDVCGDQPPFNVVGDALSITNISGTDVTLSGLVSEAQVGDWICLNNQTCVPAIPVEYRLVLAQRTVIKIYELQGMTQKMAAAEKKLEEYVTATTNLITSRVKSSSKIINPIQGGFLSGSRNRRANFAVNNRGN